MVPRACERNGTIVAAKASRSASATSASSSVKPPDRACRLEVKDRHPAGEPIDADLEAEAVARNAKRRSGRRAVGLEAHDRALAAALAAGAEDVEDDVVGQLHGLASVTEQGAAAAVDEHLPPAAGQDGAEPLAPKEVGSLERQRLELAAPGAAAHADGQRREERDDRHHGHHLDEREAGLSLSARRSKCRPTLASSGPIPRKNVLPVFESILRMSNAALVREGNLIKIVPVAEAGGSGGASFGAGQAGYGVSIVPLRYASAATVSKMAENFLSKPGAIRVDTTRNLLLIQGTGPERRSALDVVASYDVEWLRNQSVGVYPLKATAPETMIHELERIFESNEGGQGQGVIRFQPISRMNAVMAVTKNPQFLQRATEWVQRLDRSDTSGTTLRIYRVKFGNATKVAQVLNDIFVSQRSGGGDSPFDNLAPGSRGVKGRLDAAGGTGAGSRRGGGGGGGGGGLSAAGAGGGGGAQGGASGRGGGGGGGGGAGSGGAVAASFDTFSDRKPPGG